MWVKGTRDTQILATVFHKHKYITNPYITPKNRVIVATDKLADSLKSCMPPHLSKTTPKKLYCIRTILKHERTQRFQPNPPRILPNPPPPHHQTHPAYIPVRVSPTPAPLENPLTSSMLPPPRVVPLPRVPPPTVAPPPRVVTPPTAVHQVPLRRSLRLAAQRSKIED